MKDMPEDFSELIGAWEMKEISIEEVLAHCNISETTFYRRLREYRAVQDGKEEPEELSKSVPFDSDHYVNQIY